MTSYTDENAKVNVSLDTHGDDNGVVQVDQNAGREVYYKTKMMEVSSLLLPN